MCCLQYAELGERIWWQRLGEGENAPPRAAFSSARHLAQPWCHSEGAGGYRNSLMIILLKKCVLHKTSKLTTGGLRTENKSTVENNSMFHAAAQKSAQRQNIFYKKGGA
jgi:hypothetical protein